MNSFLQSDISRKASVLFLFAIYSIFVLISIFFIIPSAFGPIHYGDEIQYWDMALAIHRGVFSLSEFNNYPPFLYPLLISPAFYFYPLNAYTAVKTLNSFYFTSALFPAYLLLRKFFDRKRSLIFGLVILLNPAQFVFPRQILSENVFYPLLLWTLYFASSPVIENNNRDTIHLLNSLLLGVCISMLAITRYIAFALIPVFIVIWWLHVSQDMKSLFRLSRKKIFSLLLVLTPIFIVFLVWISVGIRDGVAIKTLMGFDIADDSNPRQLTLYRLFMWISFYGSYIVLIGSPIMVPISMYLARIKQFKQNKKLNYYLLSSFLIISAFFVASVRHSWRAGYNYPDPGQMMGRYVIYAGPLLFIAAVIVFDHLRNTVSLRNTKLSILPVAFVLILFIISYGIIYKGWFFIGTPLKLSGTSTDNYIISSLGILFPIIILCISLLWVWVIYSNSKYKIEQVVAFLALFYLIGDITMFPVRVMRQQFQSIQVYHFINAAEKMSLISREHPESSEITVKLDPDIWKSDENYGRWMFTLLIYGFRNVNFEPDERLSGEAQAYRFVRVGDIEFAVDGVNEKDYIASNCEKYEFMDKYYTICHKDDKKY